MKAKTGYAYCAINLATQRFTKCDELMFRGWDAEPGGQKKSREKSDGLSPPPPSPPPPPSSSSSSFLIRQTGRQEAREQVQPCL